MGRESIYTTKEVTQKVWGEVITCDAPGCEARWSTEDYDEDKFATIYMSLNENECVSNRWTRYYCPEHWDIWTRLCAILGVDPDGTDDE